MYIRNGIAPLLIFITEVDCVLFEVRAKVEKQLSSSAMESDPNLELSNDYKIPNINSGKDV
jgi:hypothetical protein